MSPRRSRRGRRSCRFAIEWPLPEHDDLRPNLPSRGRPDRLHRHRGSRICYDFAPPLGVFCSGTVSGSKFSTRRSMPHYQRVGVINAAAGLFAHPQSPDSSRGRRPDRQRHGPSRHRGHAARRDEALRTRAARRGDPGARGRRRAVGSADLALIRLKSVTGAPPFARASRTWRAL